jgi:hypothetical protein
MRAGGRGPGAGGRGPGAGGRGPGAGKEHNSSLLTLHAFLSEHQPESRRLEIGPLLLKV